MTTSAPTIRRCTERAEFEKIFDDILTPAFPPTELGDRAEILDGFDDGYFDVFAAHVDGHIAGTAIATLLGDPHEIVLLTWLAVGEAGRGRGVGGALVRSAVASWTTRFDPLLIIGEVEDPAHHAGSAATGDPEKRLRFYENLGARRVDTPFVMPRIAGADRVDDLFLIALGGRAYNDATVPFGEQLRAFLAAYVRDSGEEQTNGRYAPDIEDMLAAAPKARLA